MTTVVATTGPNPGIPDGVLVGVAVVVGVGGSSVVVGVAVGLEFSVSGVTVGVGVVAWWSRVWLIFFEREAEIICCTHRRLDLGNTTSVLSCN